MLDIAHLLIGSAWADAAASPAAPAVAAQGPGAELFGPQALVFLVILGIFYFLLIRPQQQKQNQHTTMLKSLQRGDKIVTGGGIIATIHKIDNDEHVVVEIADNVRIKVLRSTIVNRVDPPTAKDAKALTETKVKS